MKKDKKKKHNKSDPDYDKFGHCVSCHKNLLITKIINKKVIQTFTPDYDSMTFKLSDGSNMKVTICKGCKEETTMEDADDIMSCVMAGWEHELKMLDKWSKEKKQAYKTKYGKLKIKGIKSWD